MSQINQFNLSRNIPEHIQSEVRLRSKNGCVNCRKGIFQYEHIDPEFSEAKAHDPSRICLLCGACHDKVTRGFLTKQTILRKYIEIQNSTAQKPHDFFDFFEGNPKLHLGGFITKASPESILEVNGHSIFQIFGKQEDKPGGINAIFSDDSGAQIFSITGNKWEGPTKDYDLDTKGRSLEIRLPNKSVSLRLKYLPPDTISVERIDMRYGEWHVLASESDLAVGRYCGVDTNLIWVHVKSNVNSIIDSSCLIRCRTTNFPLGVDNKPRSVFDPLRIYMNQDGRMDHLLSTYKKEPAPMSALSSGIFWPDIGLSILVGTNFLFAAALTGVCSIEHARYNFFRKSRMNQPALHLPSNLNAASIREEVELFEKNGGRTMPLAPEPFLVKPDRKTYQRWQKRKKDGNSVNAFFDEEPSFPWGVGTIRFSDNYNGSSIRVGKEK